MFSEEISAFIQQHEHKHSKDIALLLSKKNNWPKSEIINQINGRQKAKKKLPEFFKTNDIVYPTPLSMEQCSSEATATYKSSLVSGESLVDLTAGFGIDSYYFSKHINQVISIEPNANLVTLVKQNLHTLNTSNITVETTTAEDYLKYNSNSFNWIYIDPSRRVDAKKVHGFKDCEPDVVSLLPQLLETSQNIMIKASPLVDIKMGLEDLEHVKSVQVVSLNNNCKELLFILEKNFTGTPSIHAVNLEADNKPYVFTFLEEKEVETHFSDPLEYLYEPNASILKAGAFKSIAHTFDLHKLAQNTHLYTSNELVIGFPGRCFKIDSVLAYNKKEFSKTGIKKANISTRNFDDKPDIIKKKLKLKDGGDLYLFACRNRADKPILIPTLKV